MAVAVGPDDTDSDDAAADGRMDDVIVDVVGVCSDRGGGGKRDDVDDDDVGGSGGGGANVPATAAAVA